MSSDLSVPNPERFRLASFAELLPARDPITGEDPGSFAGFHDGMMRALAPFTPYECVIAENLIAIEWELLQHRRMRDASLRRHIHRAIRSAVVDRERAQIDAALEAAWEEFAAEGGDEDDWEDHFEFDKTAAETLGDDLAARATSRDPDAQSKAYAEILDLGLSALEVMGDAYSDRSISAERHDATIQELERRRREVKRDYDALQKARPVPGEIIDG